MKIYFSESEHPDYMSSSFELDGQEFLYCVEYGSNMGGTEDFVISDTVGRAVYVDIGSIDQLIDVLQYLSFMSKRVNEAEDTIAAVCDADNIQSI